MSGEPLTVVVPVLDGERFLGECLESILSQGHAPLEVIVVDDGSTDGSAALAESFDGVHVVRRPHQGLATTRNAGIAAATSDLIAFCDADDTWLPGKVARQLEHLAADPSCDIVLCRMETVFEDGAEWPSWLRPDQSRGDLDGVSPTSGIFRRHVFERVEGYRDEPLADFSLLIRARTAGCTIIVLEDILHTRRIHDRNMQTTGQPGGTAEMLQRVREHMRHRAEPS